MEGRTDMARWAEQYQKRTSNTGERRLARQEQLLFDATELISRAMKQEGVTKAEIAKRLGKSKAFVTQVMRGQNNMTLRTLSDLADVLGYDVELGAVNPQTERTVYVGRWDGPKKFYIIQGQLQQATKKLAPSLTVPALRRTTYCFEEAA
jgi:transcriptional regulator with XRE-family HTH domain